MSADVDHALYRMLVAFGHLISRRRRERNWTVEQLAAASEFDVIQIEDMENRTQVSDLSDFFRLAWALGEDPAVLFIDLVQEWRKNPTDLGLYKSRASDFVKLYRLGYHPDPGEFRELPRVYSHIDEAMAIAKTLNATRRLRRLLPLDTVTTYVRLGNAAVQSDKEQQS